ncbi:hypothetical protein TCAL_12788 [Tigriopus californicus]|uniref:C2H2-type domain-containing protein n=1 Tax=Tigriopus californicus TaxID=6832 RepID=A0A553NTZ4_TIGCA|nr:hypothetical protein TCAL_12788 [Tigriopus californicus]|eukprot:TCALIF_12788-PA protein Name:"Similar to Zbtb49 Zinc finger and BTB domain-containing protein 49 (Mus musculus)" AED:0.34 eAED:0.35 QI:0/-1/0/1/-1/1/1/0/675
MSSEEGLTEPSSQKWKSKAIEKHAKDEPGGSRWSKTINSDVDQSEEEEDVDDPEWQGSTKNLGENMENCRSCQSKVSNLKDLLKHVEVSPSCQKEYSPSELSKSQSKMKYDSREVISVEKARLKRISNYYENRESKLQKAKQYYQKNRDEITRKKRANYFQTSHEDSTNTDLLALRRTAMADPDTANGTLNINPDAPLNFDTCRPKDQDAPSSKIDHGSGTNFSTLDPGISLTGRFVAQAELGLAESFVGMTLSGDGESIEIKYLVHRSDITISGIQNLFHGVMSVLELDFKTFLSDKGSPIAVIPSPQVPLLRNKFSKEIIDEDKGMLEESKPVCVAEKTRETHFISEQMESVPYSQLIVNANLQPRDFGAIGLQCHFDNSESMIIPLFTVNMTNWRFNTRYFFQPLILWIGSKAKFLELLLKTPCGIQAKQGFEKDIMDECYFNSLQPKKVAVCEHCGLKFEFNRFLFRELNRYKNHVETHQLDCKICGESFPNATVRRFHQRTHKKTHVKCSKEGCKWVGNTASALNTHIYFVHTRVLCDLCGKEVSNRNSLDLHRSTAHQPREAKFRCEICGKGYQTKGVLSKHIRRHNREDSLVNKWMNDNPNDYKFVCTLHKNCKKYFKSAKRLRAHTKNYENKDYPANCASNFRPHLPEALDVSLAEPDKVEEVNEST